MSMFALSSFPDFSDGAGPFCQRAIRSTDKKTLSKN
jgi:hypothetical protein